MPGHALTPAGIILVVDWHVARLIAEYETLKVDLSTIGGLIEHDHTVASYCPACRRWGTVDLRGLEARGQGDRPLSTLRVRCRPCDQLGELQLRPPMPKFEGATWMASRR